MAGVTVPGEFNFKDAKPAEPLQFVELELESPAEMTADASTDIRGNPSWAGGTFSATKLYLHDCTLPNGSAPTDKVV